MARVNVYIPDPLAEAARAAGLNVSKVTQQALAAELRDRESAEWFERASTFAHTGVSHGQALEALTEARAEFGDA
jgi:post-segregation antitoxin (ccd killing protein)